MEHPYKFFTMCICRAFFLNIIRIHAHILIPHHMYPKTRYIAKIRALFCGYISNSFSKHVHEKLRKLFISAAENLSEGENL